VLGGELLTRVAEALAPVAGHLDPR
jgi:hypothetical protein